MNALDLEDKRGESGYDMYVRNSSAPLTCFLFALPLFIVYHAGLWWLRTFAGLKWANAVDIAIANALGRLGMAGPLLSFILVVIVFLVMHAMTGKAWHWPPFHTWLLMLVESLVMALPVFMLSRLVMNIIDYLPLAATMEYVAEAAAPVISFSYCPDKRLSRPSSARNRCLGLRRKRSAVNMPFRALMC